MTPIIDLYLAAFTDYIIIFVIPKEDWRGPVTNQIFIGGALPINHSLGMTTTKILKDAFFAFFAARHPSIIFLSAGKLSYQNPIHE